MTLRASLAAMVLASLAMAEPNRLAHESSPYLLQHAHNPVDWYPWGDEAFAKAQREGKPIFLSIGYSTCHWCHVMERESFEDRGIAELMNRDFVSIKVDREERPDIDNVYMTACQLLTRSGGWPLTAILTPEGLPFFAGTYFPPGDLHGRPGMRTLLPRIAEYWKNHRSEAQEQAKEVERAVRAAIASPPGAGSAAPLDAAFAADVEEELARRFDAVHGGFSSAPKFPPHGALAFLATRADAGGKPARADAGGKPARDVAMLRRTLDAMQDGGVFDQVGGGFHRYSVDGEWFVPHFEKMLYDNAQLLAVYADAFRRFGDERYRETALAIFGWLEREMKTPEGAYASALDADSEGVEGKYYLWPASEIDAVLGPAESPLFREAFGISDRGNTPPDFAEGRGRNLPRRVESDAALAKKHGGDPAAIRRRLELDAERLEAVRARRVHPSRDDKVLTSWNALAISALARASRDLSAPRLAEAARRIAGFLVSVHVSGGRVLHGSRGGTAKGPGFLDDYAFLADALLDLSEATGDASDARRAGEIAAEMVRRFRDPKSGGFFQSEAPASGQRGLLDLAKEYLDQVEPAPNAIAVRVLRRLEGIAPAADFRAAEEAAFSSAAPYARTFPSAAASWAVLASGVAAAPAERAASAENGPVRVRAERRNGEVAVRFAIDRGWHVQSRTPSRPELVPTRVTIAGYPVEPDYPSAETVTIAGDRLAVYSGEFTVTARVPGEGAVGVGVDYQACDDSRCLAPVRLQLEASKEKR